MKYLLPLSALLCVALTAQAQVASHSATIASPAKSAAARTVVLQPSDKPVAKVNGVVLTQRDLLREMYTIFPYARQHNGGFPKSQEPAIRKGALQMIIFEELVYQDAAQRKVSVPSLQVREAVAQFKGRFDSPEEYRQYLHVEMHGSEARLRQMVRRSLVIDRALKMDVGAKSAVTLAETKAYYKKHPARFEKPETFDFQTISFLPPLKPTPEEDKKARKRAEEAWAQAKKDKTAEAFGLLAEKVSQDDFRVNMGSHRNVLRSQLPPEVVKALLRMKPGGMTGVMKIQSAYTIIRLNRHYPARKQPFSEVKQSLRIELQKTKYERLRVELDKKLRAHAKIQIM